MTYARFRLWLWDAFRIKPPLSPQVIALIWEDVNRQETAFCVACFEMGYSWARLARQIHAYGATLRQLGVE